MKHLFAMNAINSAALIVLTALLGLAAPIARGAEANDNIYNYLQLLRSDMNSLKVELVNSIMKLSAEDAKKFWPIYHDYENELGKQAINRAELVSDFVKSHKDGTFDDAKAKDIAKRWFKSQHARLDLLEKYHGKIEEALTSIQAGQFLQIENQIGLFIDMTIASEMPKVGSKAPDFSLPDQDGKVHKLSDYKGKWILLYFYPKDDTPGCTIEACTIRDQFKDFKKIKAAVLGVSKDSVKSHKKFADAYELPFTLLADEDKKVLNKYSSLIV